MGSGCQQNQCVGLAVDFCEEEGHWTDSHWEQALKGRWHAGTLKPIVVKKWPKKDKS